MAKNAGIERSKKNPIELEHRTWRIWYPQPAGSFINIDCGRVNILDKLRHSKRHVIQSSFSSSFNNQRSKNFHYIHVLWMCFKSSLLHKLICIVYLLKYRTWRIWYPQSAGSFITCIEHRYAVALLGFSGHDATFSLMWTRDLCDW
jgi:hypothetical protein